MLLRSVKLSNFRNIYSAELEFNSRFVLIHGGNGQGKTSLIEAIYLLSSLRSFRAKKIAEVLPVSISLAANEKPEELSRDMGDPLTKTWAAIETQGFTRELSYEIESGKRSSFINAEKITTTSDLYGNLATVYFIPEDLQLIKGGPEGRRLLFDQTISAVDKIYVRHSLDYLRALKNRNALLTDLAKRTHLHGYPELLEPWDTILASAGSYIARARLEFISFIEPRFKELYAKLSSNSEAYELNYRSDFTESKQVKDSETILNSLRNGFSRDLKYRYTNYGVQRDDIAIKVLGRDEDSYSAKLYASQGQSRSMALALKLACADFISMEIDESPLIMLDDVESELDLNRRTNLLQLVSERASQVFITTAAPELSLDVLPEQAEKFFVERGSFIRGK